MHARRCLARCWWGPACQTLQVAWLCRKKDCSTRMWLEQQAGCAARPVARPAEAPCAEAPCAVLLMWPLLLLLQVPRHQQGHADDQHALPRGRCRHPAVQQAQRVVVSPRSLWAVGLKPCTGCFARSASRLCWEGVQSLICQTCLRAEPGSGCATISACAWAARHHMAGLQGSPSPCPVVVPPARRRSCCRRAKYQLQHVVRTNLAASDAAYGCVFETEDEAGVRGVKLSKELMSVAGEAGGAHVVAGCLRCGWLCRQVV